jgi:hypothetical protein
MECDELFRVTLGRLRRAEWPLDTAYTDFGASRSVRSVERRLSR